MGPMRFPADEPRIDWRQACEVRRGMIVYHGTAPSVMVLGRDMKISLWSRFLCRVFMGLKAVRSQS